MPAEAPAEAPAVYASLGDRLLAVLLDGFALAAIFWLAGSWVAPRYGGLTPEGFNLTGTPALIVMGLSSLVFFAYYLCFEWWWGATLGKMVVGVKITKADGGRIGLAGALVRNLLRIVDGIGIYLVGAIAVLLTKRRQRIGDLAAGTTVHKHGYPGYLRVLAVVALLALPVAAIATAWAWRPASTGETAAISETAASRTSTSAGTAAAGGQPTAGSAGAALPDVADGPLVLTNMRIAAGKDGPDRPTAVFKAGETPTLLFEVKGFAVDQSQQGRVQLRIEGYDPDGVPINEPRETEGRPSSTSTSLESWANVSLPDYVTPGVYRLNILVSDLVGNRKVSVSAPFTVKGQPFEPSAGLVLRNLRFTEGEDGPSKSDANYRAGSTVWMAFEVVGFKTDADKSVRVQEQMTVASASGAKALDAQVLNLNRQFFYVPRQLPITNHISLGTMPPGEYQVTLVVTDSVGSQRSEQVVRFTIQ